jgi:ferrous iron transport protein A
MIITEMSPEIIQLDQLPTGQTANLLDLPHGRLLAGRLTALGFTPGVEVTMTQNYHHGPLIVTVRGVRVALGRGEARKILLKRSDRGDHDAERPSEAAVCHRVRHLGRFWLQRSWRHGKRSDR